LASNPVDILKIDEGARTTYILNLLTLSSFSRNSLTFIITIATRIRSLLFVVCVFFPRQSHLQSGPTRRNRRAHGSHGHMGHMATPGHFSMRWRDVFCSFLIKRRSSPGSCAVKLHTLSPHRPGLNVVVSI